jgi:hypothetical protein
VQGVILSLNRHLVGAGKRKEDVYMKRKGDGAIMLAGLVLNYGCSRSAPACNDKETKEAVVKIVKEKTALKYLIDESKDNGEKLDLKIRLLNIRTKKFDKETGSYECAADLEMEMAGKSIKGPITYTTELLEDGNKFYVTVHGL